MQGVKVMDNNIPEKEYSQEEKEEIEALETLSNGFKQLNEAFHVLAETLPKLTEEELGHIVEYLKELDKQTQE
jgi:hypothetical protein